MKVQMTSWSSWRSKEVLVREAGETGPIPLQIRGVFGASVVAYAAQRTDSTVAQGVSYRIWNAGKRRIILPAGYNSLDVERRSVGSSGSTGIGPWKVTRLADEDVPLAVGQMAGRGPWVLRLADGSAKTLRIVWNQGKSPGCLTLFRADSGADEELSEPEHTQETIRVAGPGYLLLDARRWTLDIA
ncbi:MULTISPECIES: hypothetical protein [unclassified Streptomyces]|uniref:hypothetical protein n=1 Tax=unclassified Streptomyces TaxID=2593676 RepID=UPI00136DC6C9|nr:MULTISPECIES: hypothetical protein [unclassified Streptomyces]NEA05373.1 hypothetical protein [Streptomyces sp. SID10116]MYY81202.1 hypothetical protein [Streptomyces sp. SID335]MYZ15999.1 hypothetical protein [Streptomyces sp. SID337]NDZ90599.1 hypothetical protein [Streptomyces sp. SID10115]NEB48638.1 hypothetical protein [Streptomyces sp. SID339]